MHDPDEPGPTQAPGAGASALAETLQLFGHDIRAAMSDVVGGLRLIDCDRLTPEARIQIDRVRAAADTLAALVDGALMAAAGDTPIHEDGAIVVVEDWLATVSGRWSGRASEASGRFELVRDGPLPGILRVPQVMLDRVIGNLVSNAVRHAPGSAACLHVTGARGAGLTLTVSDDGPGYPQSVLDRVGRGVDVAPMGQRAGSGLGLRIAAELSRQIGGTLNLSNAPGGGGLARLHLPEPLLDRDATAPAPVAPPDLGGLRVLVAEDNLTNQTILRQMLERMQANAVFVADGIAALDMLELRGFDIALVDIEMPRLSGLDVMRAVRARPDAVAAMPMVALTAYVLRDNREAIYAAGADGIIGKPISSASEFGRAILRYAGRPMGLPEPEDVLARGAGDAGLGPKMDQGRFDALMEVAGPEGAPELLQRLHEDLSAVRAALVAGVAAGDIAEIRSQTHILIAISGAVGAERLYRLSEVLNIAAKRRRVADLAALHGPCDADLTDLIALVTRRAAGIGLELRPTCS